MGPVDVGVPSGNHAVFRAKQEVGGSGRCQAEGCGGSCRERILDYASDRPAVSATLWEVPAGTLEADEPPAAAAIRELEEETGYTAKRWRSPA